MPPDRDIRVRGGHERQEGQEDQKDQEGQEAVAGAGGLQQPEHLGRPHCCHIHSHGQQKTWLAPGRYQEVDDPLPWRLKGHPGGEVSGQGTKPCLTAPGMGKAESHAFRWEQNPWQAVWGLR